MCWRGRRLACPTSCPSTPRLRSGSGRLAKDPADADWVLSKLQPQPLATWLQPIQLGNPAAAALPRAFVLCTEGKDAQTDPYVLTAERVRSDPGWRVRELADNHLALVNAPQAVAEMLLSLTMPASPQAADVATGTGVRKPDSESLWDVSGCIHDDRLSQPR